MKKQFSKKKKYYKEPSEAESPVKAKKHLGQHFLKDEETAKKIGDTLTLNGYENILEIGPGTGVLTKYILQKKKNVLAVDLDTESIEYLNQSFALEHPSVPTENFKVQEADFLKMDIKTLFNGEAFAITGNFPYNISTQIVFKALENKELVPEFTGMFQKEVAQRICGKEGNKTYGILSVLTQAFYDAEYLFTVPPSVFNPPPKVESGVLRLIRKENLELPVEEKLLYRVVKTAFQQRRKTLRNSLKSFDLSEELREDAIFGQRPEQLSVDQFIALAQKIENDAVSD